MARFLVERYLPGAAETVFEELVQSLRSNADLSSRSDVRYLGTVIVPGDDACLCLFDAPSAAAVKDANDTLGATFDRIVEVSVHGRDVDGC